MSSRKNQTSSFRHYDGQRYYIQYQAVPPPPAQTGVQPCRPLQALPKPPSTKAGAKPLRAIKPAPPTGSVKDSSSSPAKKLKLREGSSGQKEYKWVPYTPR